MSVKCRLCLASLDTETVPNTFDKDLFRLRYHWQSVHPTHFVSLRRKTRLWKMKRDAELEMLEVSEEKKLESEEEDYLVSEFLLTATGEK